MNLFEKKVRMLYNYCNKKSHSEFLIMIIELLHFLYKLYLTASEIMQSLTSIGQFILMNTFKNLWYFGKLFPSLSAK